MNYVNYQSKIMQIKMRLAKDKDQSNIRLSNVSSAEQ